METVHSSDVTLTANAHDSSWKNNCVELLPRVELHRVSEATKLCNDRRRERRYIAVLEMHRADLWHARFFSPRFSRIYFRLAFATRLRNASRFSIQSDATTDGVSNARDDEELQEYRTDDYTRC